MKINKLAILPTAAGVSFILLAFSMLLFAVQNSKQFENYYVPLVVISVAGLALLALVLAVYLLRLLYQYKTRTSGSRLRLKLVGFFILSTLIPTALLYFFAVKLLNSGIDSWFDIHVTEALQNSYELGQAAIDERKKRLIRETHFITEQLGDNVESTLLDMREKTNAYELALFEESGKVVAFSHSDKSVLVPSLPSDTILSQVKVSGSYHETELSASLGQIIRVVIKVPPTAKTDATAADRFLHAVYQMPQRINKLLDNVNETSAGFKRVEFMQPQLRQSLVVILSLVLLLALAGAIWLAFYLAKKLSQPVLDLVRGTQDVAAGVYQEIPNVSGDELGFLVDSFNQMIRKVDKVQLAQKRQWDFLDVVFTNLSSGVMVLDDSFILQRKNHAVEQILNTDLDKFVGQNILQVSAMDNELLRLFSCIRKAIVNGTGKVWELEERINIENSSRVLYIRGRMLPEDSGLKGSVIVFEDITERTVGQRNAAWSEVARRLAHEIKNPLTPIQLSAERIRNKCVNNAGFVPGNEKLITRATQTIISQVEALKKMVGDFSEFGRVPQLLITEFDLENLTNEVVELYRSNKDIVISSSFKVKTLTADVNRIRQLLHNIFKNSLEIEGQKPITVKISSEYNTARDIVIKICDDGGGIQDEMLGSIFEPYITGKPKGTGLGLAIVKRIVEEHNGNIEARNVKLGVCFKLTFPA